MDICKEVTYVKKENTTNNYNYGHLFFLILVVMKIEIRIMKTYNISVPYIYSLVCTYACIYIACVWYEMQ